MKKVKFGFVGLGLMGREIASATARWCHLQDAEVVPEVVAVCDKNLAAAEWYRGHFPSVQQVTDDYRELIANPEVEVVYCAVPHNLHQSLYSDVIKAGKDLLGEKPFGIDKAANDAILEVLAAHPESFVRGTSHFPFFPPVQRIFKLIAEGAFGNIIEVESGFLHSSDLNPNKPINWKRMIALNGEYGVMGDLGMHACHVPFRAGWEPSTVRALLSNLVKERPDGKGGMAACETWDNATMLCEVVDPRNGEPFPMTLKTFRIAPGEMNTWYIRVLGTKGGARFTTKNPKRLELMTYDGGEQSWQQIDTGHETAFPTITGGIFEFGFSAAILQMLAGFLYEREHGKPVSYGAGCVTPEETALSHRLFTAALRSQAEQSTVAI